MIEGIRLMGGCQSRRIRFVHRNITGQINEIGDFERRVGASSAATGLRRWSGLSAGESPVKVCVVEVQVDGIVEKDLV
ncbi:hypothetical protein H4W79_000234 [Nocardiopsis terrae]|uniref:Uncharacterized protein n=1 Tax=Nocardiopsis terrae TaxID=372655 RepID=A0ABR9HAF9_9ACTN|nr:hypothetical protein [Nocardiopsis terrae]MBE1456020.1 hypothetical protein [Nocardiopsis terrae]